MSIASANSRHSSSIQKRPRVGSKSESTASGRLCFSIQNRAGNLDDWRPKSEVEFVQHADCLDPSTKSPPVGSRAGRSVEWRSEWDLVGNREDFKSGLPHDVAVVAVPSRQKCPSGQGCSAVSMPVTSQTKPGGQILGTCIPESGQTYPMGHRMQSELATSGWYVPLGQSVKLKFPTPGQKVPRGHGNRAERS